jgi:hypothetical protein
MKCRPYTAIRVSFSLFHRNKEDIMMDIKLEAIKLNKSCDLAVHIAKPLVKTLSHFIRTH